MNRIDHFCIKRPLTISCLSAGDGGEVDAEGVEVCDAGLCVTDAGGPAAALVVVEILSHLDVMAPACEGT